MGQAIRNIVILGGGSAGWLTAGVIAAEHRANSPEGLSVTLIESPDAAPIGVGEGTWPSMRFTLQKMGVSETDLFTQCDAAFKQGAKFSKWITGEKGDFYYHPLVLPEGFYEADLVLPWHNLRDTVSFSDAVSCQSHLCELGLAPKQITTPEYASVANYAYHLNSGKLGVFLQKHCTEKLGVKHVLDHVIEVLPCDNGDIRALKTKQRGEVEGDLFIDCSGLGSLLLGKYYDVPFESKKHILFNDTALATQVPYLEETSPIASQTISTAQSAGWIWDIGLPTRKGVGAVYSSAHISEEKAADELYRYIAQSLGEQRAKQINYRKISINPGYRKYFWHRNCVAVGMSAGFIEPLEASALVLVESSAAMIANDMPATRSAMDIVATRFNSRLNYYWESIIDFLKLHYVLTKRTDSDYWADNVKPESIPERLQESLHLWQTQVPNKYDFPLSEEMFPAASWQYVLYGMGFVTKNYTHDKRFSNARSADMHFEKVKKFTEQCLSRLPKNRELIEKIQEFGLQKI